MASLAGSSASPMLRQALCRCSSIATSTSTSIASYTPLPSSFARSASTAIASTSSLQAAVARRLPYKPPSERNTSLTPPNQVEGASSPLTKRALPQSSPSQSLSKPELMRLSKERSAETMTGGGAYGSLSRSSSSGGRASTSTRLATLPKHEPGSLEDLNYRFGQTSFAVSGSTEEPASTTSSRSMLVKDKDNFARQYRRLMGGVIAMNNVRTELRLQERYEKPKYKRQRLQSMRHRRRFAREIGLKVAAVMKAKSQGM